MERGVGAWYLCKGDEGMKGNEICMSVKTECLLHGRHRGLSLPHTVVRVGNKNGFRSRSSIVLERSSICSNIARIAGGCRVTGALKNPPRQRSFAASREVPRCKVDSRGTGASGPLHTSLLIRDTCTLMINDHRRVKKSLILGYR